ncbi:MAG: amino acid adenylation domain-containing protein, partial [Cyanobacteriota bacterium]|nr:amino acid adenylation domain-containing protein [Cyanobacteriota bacterium]
MGEVLGVVRASTKDHNFSDRGSSPYRDYPRESCIHRLFEQQVSKSPRSTAVVFPAPGQTQQLTYQELNQAADQLAVLLQCRGVKRGTPVVLFMERSHLLIIAILAILKAGGVYVPIDPSYPQERITWMREDSCSPLILTQSSQVERLPSRQADVICLDQNWRTLSEGNSVSQPASIEVQATDLAYINYTSGSTGKPKGVMIPHRGVIRLVFATEYTPLDGQQTFLQLAPISFDAATLEIWGALLHGGCCVLYPGNGLPEPQTLKTIIQTYGVTTLWLTAALFNTLITEAPECLQGVQELLTGGEALSVQHIRLAQKLLSETNLINGYGPTESTTFTCCYRIPRPLETELSSIPIGKAIANTEVYILDEQLQPVAEGGEGELFIGGDGLAQGYLNQPELTAERFIAHPFSSNSEAKLFKTGDLVRCRADGNIEFLGRRDHQVKIRGYRIELGEIENQLLQQESVKDAVVLCREDRPGQKILVAYLVAKPGNVLQIQTLKYFLRKTLPDYMVPNAILILDDIPLTPNGKVNRKALPKPVLATEQQNIVAASTEME